MGDPLDQAVRQQAGKARPAPSARHLRGAGGGNLRHPTTSRGSARLRRKAQTKLPRREVARQIFVMTGPVSVDRPRFFASNPLTSKQARPAPAGYTHAGLLL